MLHRLIRIHSIALLVVLGFCAPSLAATRASQSDGVRLLSADSRSASVEIEVNEPELLQREPGSVSRTLWFGVPEGVSVVVDAIATETRTYDGIAFPPTATSSDAPLAVLRGVTGLRAQRVALVEVRPARYDAAAQRLVVATRMTVNVSFVGRVTPTPAVSEEQAFESIYRDLIVNYESARAFRRPIGWGAATSSSVAERARVGPRRAVGFGDASTWLRVRVAEKGIQQLHGSDLTAAGVALGIDPARIRLYTRPGLPVLAEDAAGVAGDLAEVALRIEGGEDGSLDPDDRIAFFGLGASGWQDDFVGPGRAPSEWLDHPYETHNVYWLVLDADVPEPPLRIGTRDVTPARPAAQVVSQYDARLHFEANLAYQPEAYEIAFPWDPWVWAQISSLSPPRHLDAEASGVVAGATGRVRARFFAPRLLNAFPTTHRMQVWFNDQSMLPLVWSHFNHADFDTTIASIADGPNRLSLRLEAPTPPSQTSFDQVAFLFWELRFARRFHAVSDTLEFAVAGPPGAKAYEISPFGDPRPGDFLLLDVSDPLEPVELTGWTVSDVPGGKAVQFHDDADSVFYFAATSPARLTPTLERMDVRDIRHGGADYLVICSDALEGQALLLAAHRRLVAPPFAGATTAVVRMSDILAWYGGGRMDPVAIRDFLYDAVARKAWNPAPSYVCLLGDATFDFKNVYSVGEPELHRKQVPTFGHNREVLQYHTDDWLVDLDPAPEHTRPAGGIPDLIVGRLPAENVVVASTLVHKMIDYDIEPERGPWRTRTLTLVDDLYQNDNPDPIGTGHIRQADALEHEHLPEWMDRTKVQIIEYPYTQGYDKDGARQDLIAGLNEGTVFWHYIGHGNPFKLADEDAFLITDVPDLANAGRQPFFFAAASAVGPFDNPFVTSLAEALVERANGGTIASFAGTITTLSNSNFRLGGWLYDLMLRPPELGGARTIGEASFIAKQRQLAPENDRKYHILGDPGTRLAVPRDDVRMSVIDDATGVSLGDSLPRGRRVRIEGEIHGTRDRGVSDLRADRSGFARIIVSDAPERRTVGGQGFGTASYDANPSQRYELRVPVGAGRFTARFVVPALADTGSGARVSAYFEGSGTDGSGAVVSRLVPGTADSSDRSGPGIAVRFASGGTIVAPNETAVITLEDPSGIRTLPDSSLDAIAVSVDGGDPVLLTEMFRYDDGSSTRGTLSYVLPDLEEATHVLTVVASDNLTTPTLRDEHRSEHSFEFRVASLVTSAEVRPWVVPNPFRAATGTDLVFTGLAGATTSDVRVYDIRGRLVRRLAGASEGGHAQVRWDGRDDAGRLVAAGVYLYRASLRSAGAPERGFDGRLVLLP